MLLDRVLNNGFDAGDPDVWRAACDGWAGMSDGIIAHLHPSQQRPDTARHYAERSGHSGDVSHGPRPIGQADNQVAPPCRRSPIGIMLACLVDDPVSVCPNAGASRTVTRRGGGGHLVACV